MGVRGETRAACARAQWHMQNGMPREEHLDRAQVRGAAHSDVKRGGTHPCRVLLLYLLVQFFAVILSLKGLQILRLSGPKTTVPPLFLARDSQPSHSFEELSVGPQRLEGSRSNQSRPSPKAKPKPSPKPTV